MGKSPPHRVVVTGLGVLAPTGLSVSEFSDALFAGKSGIRRISRFDASDHSCKIAGELDGFDPSHYMESKEAKRMDPFAQYAVAAAKQAVEDAGLDLGYHPERVGVIFGSGIGGIQTFAAQHSALLERGPRRVSPFFVPMMIADMSAGMISILLGAKGPNYATVSACASGAHAIGVAFKTLRWGEADAIIAGGSEAAITPLSIAGFSQNKAIASGWEDQPDRGSRPFDAKRNGFVMGEGAGSVILERLEHAQARGAKIHAEITGAAFTADAYHVTAMSPGGDGAARAMTMALGDAGIAPDKVQYINAHGTSTRLNDRDETQAIKATFGQHAYKVAISSTKSTIGHLLGASGAVELIATILSIQQATASPTINYEYPDPECDLDYVPNAARPLDIRVALSNSFGFGGHNAVLVVKKFDG